MVNFNNEGHHLNTHLMYLDVFNHDDKRTNFRLSWVIEYIVTLGDVIKLKFDCFALKYHFSADDSQHLCQELYSGNEAFGCCESRLDGMTMLIRWDP